LREPGTQSAGGPSTIARRAGERFAPGNRRLRRQGFEAPFARERLLEQPMVLAPRQLDRPEHLQMIGDELGIEQDKPAGAQPGDEVDQGDLRGVAGAVEHALAETGDRKSTRLNSSHVSISYAVFCLKKKNDRK